MNAEAANHIPAAGPPPENSPPRSGIFRLLSGVLKSIFGILLGLLILVAFYVTAGRLAMGALTYQADAIAGQISSALQMPVSIEALHGSWSWFSPTLEVQGLSFTAGQAAEQHTHRVTRAELSLDPLQSLLQRKAVVTRIAIEGLDIAVQQHADGSWTLAGREASPPDVARTLQKFILNTRLITLAESTVRVKPLNAAEIALNSIYLTLENTDAQHQLEVQLRANDQARSSILLVTMDGEPGAALSASAYLDVADLDLKPLLAGFLPERWNWDAVNAGANLWVEINETGLQSIRGTLRDAQVRGTEDTGSRAVDLQQAAASFTLSRARANNVATGWALAVQNFTFNWQQTPWTVPEIRLHLPADETGDFTFQASRLDLAMLAQITNGAISLPARAATALQILDPRGVLENAIVTSRLDGSYPAGFLLRSNVRDVAVNAWQGAPSGSGINGYVEADNNSGFVELDSQDFTLHLPQLFPSPWNYDHINARVNWLLHNGDVTIQSSVIDLANNLLEGRVQFELHNTRNSRGVRESDLSVLVGMLNMDLAARAAYLPTVPALRETMAWLKTSLQAGQLSNSGFIIRTSTIKGAPPAAKTTASWYNITNGTLEFLPEWPALTGIAGHVESRDAFVDVSTTTGKIAGITLRPTTATVRPVETGGSLVVVNGNAASATATGLDFLRTTPVHDNIGSFIDNWQGSGTLDIGINLTIPLGANPDPDGIDITVQSTASTLVMPDYELSINEIDGEITYSNEQGLNATALTARLFDAPLDASIATFIKDETARETRISGTGKVDSASLQSWPGQSEFVSKLLQFMPGDFGYSAVLTIPSGGNTSTSMTRLELKSDLVGVTNSLPEPMSKQQEQPANLELNLGFGVDQDILNVRYSDFLSGEIVLDEGGIQRGQVYFGNLNRNFTIRQSDAAVAGLLVNGDVGKFNFEEWQAVADSFQSAGNQNSRRLADYLRLVDINAGTLQIFGQDFTDINVQVRHENDAWLIYAENALVAGNFLLPDVPTMPWRVDLDYLRFPPRPEPAPETAVEEEEIDLLENVDPSTLPPIDFSTKEMSIGTNVLGAFAFELRPRRDGATISGFTMNAADAHISNRAETGGANIDWSYMNKRHTSSFDGLFAAGNLAQVLPAWGNDANVESKTARFGGSLQWAGSPLAFSLKKVSGELEMHITKGRFVDIEAGSTKVFGALNFDSLIRRLQLDFSDLFQSGFAFDNIDGNMNFETGIVNTNKGITITGPSSNITINGEINLPMQTIAADMQVQIPLGQNISMLAGMLGAWPIALSTYIASKIFQDQLEDFTTIIYRLDGPWDAPEAGFEPPANVPVLPEPEPSASDELLVPGITPDNSAPSIP